MAVANLQRRNRALPFQNAFNVPFMVDIIILETFNLGLMYSFAETI